jgi:hypothetical protein
MFAFMLIAAATAPDSARLHRMLDAFLAGAGRGEVAVHERFWAEDLVYTGSAGRRIDQPTLMREVRSAPAPKPGDPATRYAAEAVRIRQYGASAVVAFRLVATTVWPESTRVEGFLNTGMFVKRRGEWRVVGWQATRQP